MWEVPVQTAIRKDTLWTETFLIFLSGPLTIHPVCNGIAKIRSLDGPAIRNAKRGDSRDSIRANNPLIRANNPSIFITPTHPAALQRTVVFRQRRVQG